MSLSPHPIIEMRHIRKTFPGGIVANNDVSFCAQQGSLHAIIGENGAGKSTVMNILFGRYSPDAGEILLNGKNLILRNPKDAIANGIGMVTQHTTLIPALTLLENIVLGTEPSSMGLIRFGSARERIQNIVESLKLELDINCLAANVSIAVLQKTEIVKALFRDARILILDEPTATLGPSEADALYALMRRLANTGTTVLFITHKLREVITHSDSVTVLRQGTSVGQHITREVSQETLLREMLAENSHEQVPAVAEIENYFTNAENRLPILNVHNVSVFDDRRIERVRSVSFDVRAGEVLGVAGLDGSGQRELAEAIVGIRAISNGSIIFLDQDIRSRTARYRLRAGMSYIPENRHRDGLVMDFTVAENLVLGRQRLASVGGGILLNLSLINTRGDEAVLHHRILAENGFTKAEKLSGGNQQKVVLARALDQNPKLIVAMQPTRGLDVEAARYVYELFSKATAAGAAIILFSLDLDEILSQCNRISVMFNGEMSVARSASDCDLTVLGALMTGTAS